MAGEESKLILAQTYIAKLLEGFPTAYEVVDAKLSVRPGLEALSITKHPFNIFMPSATPVYTLAKTELHERGGRIFAYLQGDDITLMKAHFEAMAKKVPDLDLSKCVSHHLSDPHEEQPHINLRYNHLKEHAEDLKRLKGQVGTVMFGLAYFYESNAWGRKLLPQFFYMGTSVSTAQDGAKPPM